jgi:hypothetical protein
MEVREEVVRMPTGWMPDARHDLRMAGAFDIAGTFDPEPAPRHRHVKAHHRHARSPRWQAGDSPHVRRMRDVNTHEAGPSEPDRPVLVGVAARGNGLGVP